MATTFDITPITVATISALGAFGAAYYAYRNGRRTDYKIKKLPNDLVAEFGRLNPGVDTVEKVIELLYTDIARLNKENGELRTKVDDLIKDKQNLLEEIRKMKIALDDQKRKLGYLETRIKNSIPESSAS